MNQQSLFHDVRDAYAEHNNLSTGELYAHLIRTGAISKASLEEKQSVGTKGARHSVMARSVRWQQQTLKAMGLIERDESIRGKWQLTKHGKIKLKKAKPGVLMLGFSTRLGLAIWGDGADAINNLGEPIHLMISSPPYPLQTPRSYGNPHESEYTDFICAALEPVVRNLIDGGSIVLNLSNDVFIKGSPERSLYRERLVIALYEGFGLHKMDELIWHNTQKPPGPIAWASKKRVQLNVQWEPVYWFTNNPHAVRSNNNRVLEPHTEAHKKYVKNGGAKKDRQLGDGAYSRKAGAFGKETAGKIPKNVLVYPHACKSRNDYRKMATALGLPTHGAAFPLQLPKLFIEFLTSVDELVVDMFAGSFTSPLAAEILKRRWMGVDCMYEYVRGGAERFRGCDDFKLVMQ